MAKLTLDITNYVKNIKTISGIPTFEGYTLLILAFGMILALAGFNLYFQHLYSRELNRNEEGYRKLIKQEIVNKIQNKTKRRLK